MGLFKTDEEKAQERAAQEAAEQDRAREQAEAEKQRAEAAFAASPAGQAIAAKEAGRRYFQLVDDVASTSGSATWEGNVLTREGRDQVQLIEAVEDQGWVLHDVGYVFQETASDSKSKAIGSGERTAVSGKIVGIYLFKLAAG